MRIAVVGAGVMGLATAGELAARGHDVTVFERDVVGNDLASSTDRSKVFRLAYPDPFYADLGRRALPLWRELEREVGEPLLEQCGVLYLDRNGATAEATDRALTEIGAPHELLDASGITKRFPQFRVRAGTLGAFDPSGGFVRADRAVAAFAKRARSRGAVIEERRAIGDLDELRGDAVVVAAGPWTHGLLGDLPLRTTRQQTVYARPRRPKAFGPDRFPAFIEEPRGFYGVPVHADGALKIAGHLRGAPHAPLERQIEADEAFVDECRRFWRETIPDLADADVVSSRSCIYNDTPDEDFLIGRLASGVVVCTGFSGHGFKFAPLVGRLTAQLVCGEPADVDLGRFSPARPAPFRA